MTAVAVVSCPATRKVRSSSLATGVSNLGERQSFESCMGQAMEEKGMMHSSLDLCRDLLR